jgi:bifunctional pyridoxal-dependent enzyme with beta-cystathionase and maltose regulon repressor activities
MSSEQVAAGMAPTSRAVDPASLARHFGDDSGLLPLWIAEPYVELAPAVTGALEDRAEVRWYGYETRPQSVIDLF